MIDVRVGVELCQQQIGIVEVDYDYVSERCVASRLFHVYGDAKSVAGLVAIVSASFVLLWLRQAER